MSDIISVISPPPPGHTSYPKRKLETLFSPQLGDEEWLGSGTLVTLDSPGLQPVWCHLAANVLCVSRSHNERDERTDHAGAIGKKCPLNNSVSAS